MTLTDKEVYFDQYCQTCKHKDLDGTEEPCNECLHEPSMPNSHKPLKYEKEKEKKNA